VARRLMEHGQPLPLRRKGALRAVRRERRRRSAAQAHD
jgi:hypothetical protein